MNDLWFRTESVVSETDARAMVRLLADTAALRADHAGSKRFLMDGLCDLIGADAWIWTLGCDIRPGGPQTCVGFMHGGFDDQRFTKLLTVLENPDVGRGFEPFDRAFSEKGSIITMRKQDMQTEAEMEQFPEAKRVLAEAEVVPLIMYGYPLEDNAMSGIAVYRRHAAEDFTERESKIAHIVISEVPWLHLAGWPEDRGADVPKLFPRQRMVLNLLLDGMDRKQIAGHLGLAENTVAGYSRDIYRHFQVHSQAQLMRKFLTGTPLT